MKRNILLIVIIFTSILSNAQENKFSLGVAGSYDIYNFNFIRKYYDPTYEATPAYNIGFRFQYNFSLLSGLFYSEKGYKANWNFVHFRSSSFFSASNIYPLSTDLSLKITLMIENLLSVCLIFLQVLPWCSLQLLPSIYISPAEIALDDN